MRLALLVLLAACGPRVVPADAPHAGACDPAPDFACWSALDAGVHCHVGADARAACLADPDRPPSAPCE